MKPDNSVITDFQYLEIQKHVAECLLKSGALGIFPTPVDQIIQTAKIQVVEEATLSEGFLNKLRRKFGFRTQICVKQSMGCTRLCSANRSPR